MTRDNRPRNSATRIGRILRSVTSNIVETLWMNS
jgi:hypothetical protein